MMKFKVYFAGAYETKLLIDWMARSFCHRVERLSDEGIEVQPCSRWHSTVSVDANEKGCRQRVAIDFADIDDADYVVSTYPYGYGTSAELGYAVGKGKPIIYICDHDWRDDMPFAAYHESVHVANSVDSAAGTLFAWADEMSRKRGMV